MMNPHATSRDAHSRSAREIDSPYLTGIHTPLKGETPTTELKVTEGAWPEHLSGLFARNTPNPQFEPLGRYHWFDGDGMVHGVRFEGGSARYSARYVQTAGLEAERTAGEAMWTGILEPPRRRDIAPLKDTANTDLTWHNRQLLASWWLSGAPHALTPDLETLGVASFTKALPHRVPVGFHSGFAPLATR